MRCKKLVFCFLVISLANQAWAKERSSSAFKSEVKVDASCSIKPEIKWRINAIFDTSAPDTIWLHRLANFLHIDTKKSTLNNETAFLSSCKLNKKQLDELERHLRGLNYLRDAKVTEKQTQNGKQHIEVETWDNWTMMPTLGVGRKGGKNRFSFGIQDRNMLGYGVDAELKYFSNAQRSGYKFKVNAPLYLKQNAYVNLAYVNSDDGEQKSVIFRKPFVSLNSHHAGLVGFNDETRIDSIFQNGQTIDEFNHDINQLFVKYGFSHGLNNHQVLRYQFELEKQQDTFYNATNVALPQNRDWLIAWAGAEYIQDQFKKMTNLYLIDKTEDINLGWHAMVKLGLMHDQLATNGQFAWQFYLNKNTELGDWVNVTKFSGAGYHFNQSANPWWLKLNSEWFYRFNNEFGFYSQARLINSKNQFFDQPIALGGDNGLRGFPLQYQHGDNQVMVNIEGRYYPHINLFKLFNLGAVAFFDAGKSYGNSQFDNNDTSLLKSLGIGARFYSNRASDTNVVHIDLAHPLSNDPQVNGFEVRVEVQHQF